MTAIAGQNYPPELVSTYVVDHDSSDDTARIVQSHNATLLRLEGGYVGKARNLAIAAGKGSLIAFVDAHSTPAGDWLLCMTDGLREANLAACQGTISYAFSDKHVERWATNYGMSSSQQAERWQSGKWTVFPFIATGNALCRRDAVEAVGGFDESLSRCEDLDLSWRLLLAGYQLGVVPSGCLHHDCDDTWGEFLRKYIETGRSMAQIALKYQLCGNAGLWPLFAPSTKIDCDTLAIRGLTLAGYWVEMAKLTLLGQRPPKMASPSISSELRPFFVWDDEHSVSISREIVYWTSADDEIIAVEPRSRSRFSFSGVACLIFKELALGYSRASVIENLHRKYQIPENLVADDVDEFVRGLLSNGILVRLEDHEPNLGPTRA